MDVQKGYWKEKLSEPERRKKMKKVHVGKGRMLVKMSKKEITRLNRLNKELQNLLLALAKAMTNEAVKSKRRKLNRKRKFKRSNNS